MQQTPYPIPPAYPQGGAPVEYGGQPRAYGLVPAQMAMGGGGVVFPYAMPPAGPGYEGMRGPFAMGTMQLPAGEQMVYGKDAGAALADRFSEQLHIGQGAGRGRGMYFEQRMPQGPHPHHAQPLFYPGGPSRQPLAQQRGNAGRGRGPPGRGPPPPKRRPQKGLEDNIRRTVYISYIDLQVTEEQLATFFSDCGRVVDCRICGDPNSAMRFAFIEFQDIESAQKALSKSGAVLGSSPLRVLPSKTAIVPVNKELMPRSHDDIERCSRTVYIANIDKKVDRNDVKNFFEQLCGKVSKIRLLGDYAHSTRIAFIEFVQAEGAMAALNCSGALLGSLPIRVSPSKTPVRSDSKPANEGSSQAASE